MLFSVTARAHPPLRDGGPRRTVQKSPSLIKIIPSVVVVLQTCTQGIIQKAPRVQPDHSSMVLVRTVKPSGDIIADHTAPFEDPAQQRTIPPALPVARGSTSTEGVPHQEAAEGYHRSHKRGTTASSELELNNAVVVVPASSQRGGTAGSSSGGRSFSGSTGVASVRGGDEEEGEEQWGDGREVQRGEELPGGVAGLPRHQQERDSIVKTVVGRLG